MCEINLEAELFTLQDSNAKLVAALHEANSSVEQWKKQLAEYQEETDRLRDQVTLCGAQDCSTALWSHAYSSVLEEICITHFPTLKWLHAFTVPVLSKSKKTKIDEVNRNLLFSLRRELEHGAASLI